MKKIVLVILLLLAVTVCRTKNDNPTGAQLNPADEGTEGWTPVFQPAPERLECSENKIVEILEPVDQNTVVVVNCNLTLEPGDVVTKRLILQGEASSGVTLNCNGAEVSPSDIPAHLDSIEVRSVQVDNEWEPAHNVTIQNCNIQGSVRIYGMGKNGNNNNLTTSSRTLEHTYTARNNAPYHIDLDNITISGRGRIPLYIAPGVHHSSLSNSTIEGHSTSVMMYLDAETYGISIYQNVFDASRAGREAIALDGSSYGAIVNNRLLNVPKGGIYLYRNCGENGTIRHATPSYNEITNNEIRCIHNIINWYAAIYLGSRDGSRGYCEEDSGYPYGSSVSDQDHVRYNMVTGNELHGCLVKSGNKTNHSNTIN